MLTLLLFADRIWSGSPGTGRTAVHFALTVLVLGVYEAEAGCFEHFFYPEVTYDFLFGDALLVDVINLMLQVITSLLKPLALAHEFCFNDLCFLNPFLV